VKRKELDLEAPMKNRKRS
jgi:hypothetical protein